MLVLATICGAAWSLALSYALLAAAVVAVAAAVASRGDERRASLLRVEAGAIWIASAVLASVAVFAPVSLASTVAPAFAVLALGVAPASFVVAGRAGSRPRTFAAAVAVVAPIGACLTLLSTSVGLVGLLTAAALLGVVALAIAGWVSEPWRSGCVAAGVAALGGGSAWSAAAALVAVVAPLGWFREPWTGSPGATARDVFAGPDTSVTFSFGLPAVFVLLALAAAAVVAATSALHRRPIVRREPAFLFSALVAAAALTLAPVAGAASVLVACITTTTVTATLLVGAAAVARTRPRSALTVGALAVLPAIAATGWAAVTPTLSLGALSAVFAAGLLATFIGRAEPLRSVHLGIAGAAALTFTGLAFSAAGSSVAVAGFAAAVAATTIAVVGATPARQSPSGGALEWVGALGFAIGARAASEELVWLAGALTVAVPLLTVVAFDRARRTPYGVLAATAALAASWAWLGVADVTVVEAYTLPAALAALVIGELALAHRPGRSLLTLGPAIALALGPTLALAVANDDVVRSVVVAIAAFVLVLVGARRKLQAPLVLGAAALLVLAIDTLGPAAARLPRWVVLAIPGVILLWVGANFERRRDAVRQAAHRFVDFT